MKSRWDGMQWLVNAPDHLRKPVNAGREHLVLPSGWVTSSDSLSQGFGNAPVDPMISRGRL